jgi:MFS family permease
MTSSPDTGSPDTGSPDTGSPEAAAGRTGSAGTGAPPGRAPDAAVAPATPKPVAFRGWWVVTGCFIVLCTSSGLAFYGLAVYLNAFSNERGWSLSSISLATTLFFVVVGAMGLWVARLISRVDVRWVIVIGGVVGGGALAVLGQVQTQVQLVAVYAVFAVGFAMAGLVPATTVVTRWFHRRRSVALSIASTGLSVGGIVLTPIAKRLLDDRGLAAGTPWLGLLFVVGTVPFAWFLVRPDPAADGWSPDGVPLEAGSPAPVVGGIHFDVAVRTRFFVAVTIGYLLVLGSQVGGIQQLVKLVEDRTDPATARFAITFLAATSVIARLVGGRLAQVVPMMGFTVVLSGVQALAMISLGFATSTVMIFASIVLFGTTIGNILMLQPLLIAERFGVLDYPRIYSRSQFVAMAGTAGGPLLLGWLYDVAGTYRTAYAVGALCSLLGMVVLAWGGPATLPADD